LQLETSSEKLKIPLPLMVQQLLASYETSLLLRNLLKNKAFKNQLTFLRISYDVAEVDEL
jgi:hypothetical protein